MAAFLSQTPDCYQFSSLKLTILVKVWS